MADIQGPVWAANVWATTVWGADVWLDNDTPGGGAGDLISFLMRFRRRSVIL